MAVDDVISPEHIVSNYMEKLIDLPGSLQVLDFAEGGAQLVAVKAFYGGPLVGHEIRLLREHMPNIDTRVAAIFRRTVLSCQREQQSSRQMMRCFLLLPKNTLEAVLAN